MWTGTVDLPVEEPAQLQRFGTFRLSNLAYGTAMGPENHPSFWGFGWSCRLVTSAGAEETLAGFRGSEG